MCSLVCLGAERCANERYDSHYSFDDVILHLLSAAPCTQKAKGAAGSPDKRLQAEKTLGWATSRLKKCTGDLRLCVDSS